MTSEQLRVFGVGLLYILIFGTGYALGHAGKPYGSLLFNVHKLAALGLAVLLGYMFYRATQSAAPSLPALGLAVVTALALLALFVTGALLSVPKEVPGLVRIVHHVSPYLAVVCSALAVYLQRG